MAYLHGERITLRDYRLDDMPHIRQWVNDAEITGTLHDLFQYPQTVHDTESYLNMMVENKSADNKGFVISFKDSLDYIGQIDLHRIDWKNRSASLGIVIGRKDCLDQGYGSEAIGLLQRFAFHSMNLNRLDLDVYEFNLRAYRCYLKCGFLEEGRRRKSLFREGKYWDVIQMSILREEWEQRKRASSKT
ncbi:GNAT family N-acetyltransferase [Cohnella sp. CFH 77786]|uniref:GNAT family N-acetyltransferase n=1 Tax=Cohnella sp. CFH 77786 TaxID=2662265 RepID=UPI001C60B24F|nr:GNAT family protein [Cohnella sp. CFH 77786]MBW5444479.1 GNAT family N-acetyltransferase [Cohnella sp. CFH 77786]